MEHGFQLEDQGPQAYERYLVPAFFVGCAEQLLDRAPPRPGQRVLDVACGTGIVARLASARLGERGAVAGVDVNDGMIEVARMVALDVASGIEWRTGDAAALPWPDSAFDVVYCQQGLQFFSDRPKGLREIRRVLVPSGRVAVAIWRDLEHNPVFDALVGVLRRHADEETAALMRGPFVGPNRDEIRRLLVDAGFEKAVIRIGVVATRFPSVEEFLRQEVISGPLAKPIGALDEDRYSALSGEFTRRLADYVDDDGIAFPLQTWLATAYR